MSEWVIRSNSYRYDFVEEGGLSLPLVKKERVR